MNSLQRALIEKAGHDSGFEHVVESNDARVVLASARHRARVEIADGRKAWRVVFGSVQAMLLKELERAFPNAIQANGEALIPDEPTLARFLRRTADLARALPNQVELNYQRAVASELEKLPLSERGTEVERVVRQRLGQQGFRAAMLDYWGSACAVTSVAVVEALRASHAKPWSDCTADAERLDVFNGFLLTANFDALFDRFLISFDDQGGLLVSPNIATDDLMKMGISENMHLRWLTDAHRVYLAYHRERFFAAVGRHCRSRSDGPSDSAATPCGN
jgi:hypothetical protein